MASPKRENKSKAEASAPVQPSADVSAASAVAVEPRGNRPRPILAAGLALGAVLLFIALLDYQSHQAFFFSGNESLKGSNAIGSLGATFAILLFKFSGIAAFFIPLCIMLAAGFSLWRGVRTLFPWRIPLMISAFCCFTVLLSFFDSPDSWMQSREFRDYVPSGGGGTLGNTLYHGFLEIVFGELGSFVLVVILYAICLLGLVVDNPIRKISARIQWLGNYLKRHFSSGPRRIPAQNSRKRPPEIQTNRTEKIVPNASPEAAPTEGAVPQPVPTGTVTDGPVVPVSDELPDAADHAFLTDPLGPIFPEPELIPDSDAAVVAAPSEKTATESREPETVDDADGAAPDLASDTLLFDDFTLPEVVPDGTPDTGTVVRASVLASQT
jgi:DNA segregation ATPase FtsK/SpoIIIE-like protein